MEHESKTRKRGGRGEDQKVRGSESDTVEWKCPKVKLRLERGAKGYKELAVIKGLGNGPKVNGNGTVGEGSC